MVLVYDCRTSLGRSVENREEGTRRPAGRLQQFRQEVLAGSERLLWRRWWEVIKFRMALDYFALERGYEHAATFSCYVLGIRAGHLGDRERCFSTWGGREVWQAREEGYTNGRLSPARRG